MQQKNIEHENNANIVVFFPHFSLFFKISIVYSGNWIEFYLQLKCLAPLKCNLLGSLSLIYCFFDVFVRVFVVFHRWGAIKYELDSLDENVSFFLFSIRLVA